MKIAGIVLVVIIWILMFFVGYFFASSIYLPIVSIILSIGTFYFFRKSSRKLAIVLSILTLFVFFGVIVTGFEEDYCWGKGEEAERTGLKMVIATKEDAEDLKGFEVKEGAQIGAGFRSHMLCHNTFNFPEALRENYSFIK